MTSGSESAEARPSRGDGPDRSRPRVLVLDEEPPVPPHTGKKIRTLALLSRLADRYEIDLLVHGRGVSPDQIEAMRRIGVALHLAPGGLPPKRGPAFVARVALSLASPYPYSVSSHHRPGYRRALRSMLRRNRYDVLHCEWTPYARYLVDRLPQAVVSAHNVECEVWRRLSRSERFPLRRWLFALQAKRMENFERAVFARAGWATAVSERDARTLRSFGCRRVTVVPNGVDLDYFQPQGPPPAGRDLVFTGSLDWRPNQEAVEWFVREVFPRLRPLGCRFSIVGRRPPPELDRLARASGGAIELAADVPDIRPYVRRAAAYVVPLLSGGGSRLKILEAMAMERPVISTPVGAEGLRLEPGRHYLAAADAAGFAAAVERVLVDRELALRLAAEGRRFVTAHHGWDAIAGRLASVWEEAAGAPGG